MWTTLRVKNSRGTLSWGIYHAFVNFISRSSIRVSQWMLEIKNPLCFWQGEGKRHHFEISHSTLFSRSEARRLYLPDPKLGVLSEPNQPNQSIQEIVEDRGAWYATVHGVAKSWTWLSNWTATTNLGEGKYLSQAHSSLTFGGNETHNSSPFQPLCHLRQGVGDKWETLIVHNSGRRVAKRPRFNHRTTEYFPPTSHCYITKGLFTTVPFTQYIMSAFQQRKYKTH